MTPVRDSTGQPDSGMRPFFSRLIGGHADRFENGVLDGPPRAWCGCDVCTDTPIPMPVRGTDSSTRHCAPTVPVGVIYDPAHLSTEHWTSDQSTAPLLWCINGDYYGSLQWEVASVDSTSRTLLFGRGGFQAAQSSSRCTAFYIENVKEELDAPGEFFFDNKTGDLLYYLNSTAEPQADFVASYLKTLVRVEGTAASPTTAIRFHNLTFSHAASTVLEPHASENLGGGDYAVHRGAAVEVEGAENITIDGCRFDSIMCGSNVQSPVCAGSTG